MDSTPTLREALRDFLPDASFGSPDMPPPTTVQGYFNFMQTPRFRFDWFDGRTIMRLEPTTPTPIRVAPTSFAVGSTDDGKNEIILPFKVFFIAVPVVVVPEGVTFYLESRVDRCSRSSG